MENLALAVFDLTKGTLFKANLLHPGIKIFQNESLLSFSSLRPICLKWDHFLGFASLVGTSHRRFRDKIFPAKDLTV